MMIKKEVNDLERWTRLENELETKGYKVIHWQHGCDCPEGLYVTFFKGDVDVEVHTMNPDVEQAIGEFTGFKRKKK